MEEEISILEELEKKGIKVICKAESIDSEINIKIPDIKYFHKTKYASLFKENFDEELKPNTLQFNLTFNTLKTLVKFYLQLVNYKQNKIERHKDIKSVLEEYNNNIKNNIQKCYDKYCIELSYEFEKWYDELLQIEEKKKYNYKGLEKEVKPYLLEIKGNRWLKLDSNLNKKIQYDENKNYKVIREKEIDDKLDFNKIDYHKGFLMRFKKKYKQELHLREYNFIIDTLYLIIYIHKRINKIDEIKKGINAYFIDHPEKIKINDDFDNNYDMIKIICTTDDINTIKVMIKSLILKNIHFFKVD